MGDVPDVTSAMTKELTNDGYRVKIIVPGDELCNLSADCYAVNLQSPEAIKRVHRLISGSEDDPVGCLINLLPLVSSLSPDSDAVVLSSKAFQLSNALFLMLREFHDDLSMAAEAGGSLVLNVTGLDGHFGLSAPAAVDVAVAGTLGVTKAFQRECPGVVVRTIDLDRSSPSLSQQLLDELERRDAPLETGLTAAGRTTLTLIPQPLRSARPSLPIDAASVVLVTGGGQGITAEIVRALAASQCLIVIVGRSEMPAEEAAETRDLDDLGLRQFLYDKCAKSALPFTASTIEQSFQRISKARILHSNLDAFRQAGARVEYHSLDVRDATGFARLIDDLYLRHGRIDGVLHGAGVIHDKLIVDKIPEKFAEVFQTKVDSAFCLATKLRPQGLKFFVLFSSISGRFGNRGQTDYAAANEILNKLSRQLSRDWPSTRVVAINWGPWDGGMVSDALRHQFAAHGIEVIPVEEGVNACLSELTATDGEPEIVLACSLGEFIGRRQEVH